jgi:hypothetical protein
LLGMTVSTSFCNARPATEVTLYAVHRRGQRNL